MQNITRKTNLSEFPDTDFTPDSLFFDIETTGFSPANSFVYMIGCAYKKEEDLIICQFFADCREEEDKILQAFLMLCQDFATLISFNGVGFDLPFLMGRLEHHKIPDTLDKRRSIDLFKELSSLKHLIVLENYKQKTVERFLGIHRQDLYSGGELVALYKDYSKSPDQEMLNFLLLHNYEDLLGMVSIYSIRNYRSFLSEDFQILNCQIHTYQDPVHKGSDLYQYELLVDFLGSCQVPKAIQAEYAGFFLSIDRDQGKLRIPVFAGELKFFHENYRDYYYLPREDRAVHKSLAEYVDRDYREKCHAYNCYTTKEGYFLPQLSALFSPAFRKNYKDKILFFEMTRDFFSDEKTLKNYLHSITDWIRLRDAF